MSPGKNQDLPALETIIVSELNTCLPCHLDTSAPVYLLEMAGGCLQGFFPLGFLTLSSLVPSGTLNSILITVNLDGNPWPGKNVGYLLSLSDNSVI